jgi:hypothetical protein
VSATAWLVIHLVAVAVLAGVGWVVQLVVYPAFALVGRGKWATYHDHHTRAIVRVVAVPWVAQGISVVALLLAPPGGAALPVVALAVLALVTVVVTVAAAVPVHRAIALAPEGAGTPLATLLRVNGARTLVWTASALLAAAMLL